MRRLPTPTDIRGFAERVQHGWGAIFALAFAVMSYGAMRGKSPTHDEPLHAVAGFVARHYQDFRVDPEDPPLLGFLATLPHRPDALRVDVSSESYVAIPSNPERDWDFVVETLFQTPGPGGRLVDAQAFINRSRLMFTAVAAGLCLIIWWWSAAAGGLAAASIASALFAFDPNFLAHGSIVKNDVPLAALLLAFGFAMWRFGERGTPLRLLAVAGIAALAMNMKFSGVLVVPAALLLLSARAAIGAPWVVGRRTLSTARARLMAAGVSFGAVLAVAGVVTWAAYGFRYAPMTGGRVFDSDHMAYIARAYELRASRPAGVALTRAEVDAAEPSMRIRTLVWLDGLRLLPQGWTHGLLYTYATTLVRPAFLLGETSHTGWWYYFPAATALKLPLASLLAVVIAAVAAGVRLRSLVKARTKARMSAMASATTPWLALCLIVPPAIFAFVAMAGNINIGIRHFLPVYPYLYAGTGLVLGAMLRRTTRRRAFAAVALSVALAAETLSSHPHYIPFFNLAARSLPGARGGLGLLADSNIDWGQDLPLLARWQRSKGDRPLFLSYFGTADPAHYGIAYVNLPYGYPWGPEPAQIDSDGFIAVSANNLQGIYIGDPFRSLRRGEPLPPNGDVARLVEVLGGSIYVYELRGR